MSRKRGGVEIRVTARLLAGAMLAGAMLGVAMLGACVSAPREDARHPFDNGPWSAEPPEGLDYAGAVRCAGLLGALLETDTGRTLSPELPPLQELYARWAYLIAFNAGEDPRRAAPDSAARQAEIVAAVKGRAAGERLTVLQEMHGAEIGRCMAAERLPPPEPPMVVT